MKKFMNMPDQFVAESLAGFVAAHSDLVAFGEGRKYVRRRQKASGKVALISGGGAGHEPMHMGFVGHGMLDAACTGHIFTSPTPDQILAAIEGVDGGQGCLLVVKNYDGDLMNFEMAAEAAGRHRIESVVVADDVATGNNVRGAGRRGVAGTVVVEKILGAAAEAGMGLAELKSLGDAVAANTRTMGVALRAATPPGRAEAAFELRSDEMEVGVGIHSEPGRAREPFADADAVATIVCDAILSELEPEEHGSALLLVNGFGGTPVSELYLVYNAVRRLLQTRGVAVARSLVGPYVTALDMAGMSVTLSSLDERRLRLWDAPVVTPALRWGF